jgi:hypothetical protein
MGKVTFEDAVKEETPTQEIVVKAETTLAMPTIADPEKGLVGEWTTQDLRLPRLSLVNKSGDLSNSFVPGCWVIQKEHQISDLSKDNREKGEPVVVIGARMAKQYQENVPYELRDSVPTRVFNTAAEVRENGGIVSRRRGEGNFAEIAHIEFFIQAHSGLSADAEALFFYTFGEHKYARVIYTASSTSFSAVAVTMASALRGHLAATGLIGGFWQLGSVLVKDQKNSWWQPTLRSAGLVDDDTQEEIKAVL